MHCCRDIQGMRLNLHGLIDNVSLSSRLHMCCVAFAVESSGSWQSAPRILVACHTAHPSAKNAPFFQKTSIDAKSARSRGLRQAYRPLS